MKTTTFTLDTGHRDAVVDLTPRVLDFVRGEGDGLLTVFVPHATAGVTIMELEPGTTRDAVTALDHLLPRDDRWRHRHGSPGHGADHVLPLVTAPSITIPVVDGQPTLGTWQSIALVDRNVDNPRRTVRLAFLPG